MSKVIAALLITQVARALCLRVSGGAQQQRAGAFVLPSTAIHAEPAPKRPLRHGAEAVSSSNEPLPPVKAYVPPLAPGDLKYMNQTLHGDFRPANNYVLIVKQEAQEYSAGGVYIGKQPNKEFAGRVLAVGPGRVVPETGAVIPMTVKVGDMVLYDPPTEEPVVSGTSRSRHRPQITYKNQQCVMVTEDQIYARIETDGLSPRPLSSADIRPLSDRLLVRIIDSPKKTQSGLVLARANETDGTIFRATVISAGPGEYTQDGKLLPVTEFKPGDTVLFSDAAADGGAFDLHRTQHAFVRRRAILARV
ncbi:chaperonin, 10 kDa family protein, putative [Babesia bigemina]|uniref:Chaperonin, 10 kDa family protein, putative n=1 Tax=Babesia bigemina TaxID=5866 RepID=A0A061DA71_BABBI|nr:chaperonin, 10 kDa family protein, putative [Babesia bigemina]CDR96852.1 chaperonin, 10 kDa family protein, putative [Babesia bigemina]|eukprot:XP_012769038.1 chaperonin, 10 kDa family protein, putative [Babesia bigemina]